MPSANPRQLWAHWLKSFRTVAITSGFPDLSGKVLFITFKFSSLDYSTMFLREQCKQNSSGLFKYREVITIKTLKAVFHSVKILGLKILRGKI